MNLVLDQEVAEVFPNLRAELARKNISNMELSSLIGKSPMDLRSKMIGESEFTLWEIYRIKKHLFPDLTIDYLFSKKPIVRLSDECLELLAKFVAIKAIPRMMEAKQ